MLTIRVNIKIRRQHGRPADWRLAQTLPTVESVAAIAGGTGTVATVIERGRRIIAPTAIVIVIVVASVLRRRDRKTGADDARKRGRGGCATAAMVPSARTDISDRALGRSQALARGRPARIGDRRLDRRQGDRRDRGNNGGAAK